MGGTAAFLAACRVPGLSAAVAFYGGMIGKFADEKPKCPLQMHFGEKDEGIPMDVVDEIKKKQPQAETYTYPDAPHGFYCDERASYRKDAGRPRLEAHGGVSRQAYEEIRQRVCRPRHSRASGNPRNCWLWVPAYAGTNGGWR